MRKHEYKGLDLEYYRETLENGLEVILIPMEEKKNYFITYATRFGSDITTFKPKDADDYITVPTGVAHFLEHKMFEEPDGMDPFTFFSKSGTGSNASTTYNHTQYICYGTKNFNENLRYLIKFVNNPYYTNENVEKEKGIITQELKMYNDMPDFQLEMKLRQNVYHELPRRIDIGGSIEDVNRITKEDLYDCYNNFYSPNNMFIVIAGNFNPKEAIRTIIEELELKENVDYPEIKRIYEKESVRKRDDTIKANVEVPKVALALKIKQENLEMTDKFNLGLYLSMLSAILFGSASLFKERVMEEKLMSGMICDWETTDEFKTMYLMAESEKPLDLLDEIKKELKEVNLDEQTFERIKKVWIANEVRSTDDVEAMVYSAFDDMLYTKEVINDKIDRVRNMKFEVLENLIKKIDFNNIASIIMYPSK